MARGEGVRLGQASAAAGPKRAAARGDLRLFVALGLPPSTRARLVAAQRALVATLPRARPVSPQNLHLTLRFVGALAPAALPALQATLRALGQPLTRAAELRGVGTLQQQHQPHAVVAHAADPSGQVSALADAIELACAPYATARPHRPRCLHVTLLRLPRAGCDRATLAAALAPVGELLFGPTELSWALFSSTLTPAGADYERLPLVPAGHGGADST